MASNQLSSFINHIKKNGIARTARFRITFTLPKGLKVTSSTVQKSISLTCMLADIPGKSEQTADVTYGNYARKVVFGRSTGDFNTTFLLTGNYIEKKIFDAWHDTIFNDLSNSVNFYDDYIAGIKVESLNEQDNVVYSFELTEAYPIQVSPLKLDRTSQNTQMALDVNWAYHKILPGQDARDILESPVSSQLISNIPGVGSGKNRLFPIPGLDTMSSAVQSAVETVKEFRGQVQGVLKVAKDVQEQIRDAKMNVIDGVKTLNGVIKDFKAIANVPTEVKNEVVAVITDSRNQLGYLKNDVTNFKVYPKR